MELLTVAFWRLLAEIPANCESGSLGQPGLTQVESTVQWLVEILHAITLGIWTRPATLPRTGPMSVRSFAYGSEPGQTVDGASVEEGRGQGQGEGREGQVEEQSTHDVRLAGLRQVLVEWLVSGMYKLREVGGPRCTPYMQLAVALAT